LPKGTAYIFFEKYGVSKTLEPDIVMSEIKNKLRGLGNKKYK